MQEFDISIRSFSEVQTFVAIATVQPFRITVGNEHQQVNAKSFMGLLSLDLSQPVQVRAECSSDAFEQFRLAVAGVSA